MLNLPLANLRLLIRQGLILNVFLASFFLTNCATRPTNTVAPPVLHALAPAKQGALARVSKDVEKRFGSEESAFHLLTINQDALMWRLALIDHATTSIDIQYYLWNNDDAGGLLFMRLLDAADRGVRVRLLVDDFLFNGGEKMLAAISHHPNLDIKIYNPKLVRQGAGGQLLEWAIRFGKLNRRMHNKAFIVDNQLAIMGGRNIGNAYFGLSEKYNFIDLDVLTTGRVVEDISEGFDVFWNSKLSVAGQVMSKRSSAADMPAAMAKIRDGFAKNQDLLKQTPFPLRRKDWTAKFRGVAKMWHRGTAVMLQDQPVTDLTQKRQSFLASAPNLTDTENPKELIVVSPYLIPGELVYGALYRNSSQGADVRILTASLGSTNQPLVHSKFRKHRKEILASGAKLYEFRHDPAQQVREFSDTYPVRSKYVSIHAKTSVGDRETCFIGSLNLDPRSIDINTENGLFIRSPSLARELAEHLELLMATENGWRVTSTKNKGKGFLRWSSKGKTRTTQPAPNFGKRVADFIYGFLPIEGQL